jgi:hypothetical protein
MYIFLDDERSPEDVTWLTLPSVDRDRWHIARNIDEFRTYLDFHLVEIKHISFDHDLGLMHYGNDYSDERTGFHCAKLLVERCMDENIPLPSYAVHSMNPVGRENIMSYLDNFKRVQDGV